MAVTATLDFSNGEGPDFQVVLSSSSGSSTNNPASTVIDSVTIDPLGVNVSFTPGLNDLPLIGAAGIAYIELGTGTGGNPPGYINWRSAGTVLSHPTSGYSFDMWFANGSDTNDLNTLDWNAFQSKGSIPLNPTKHTVFYDYDNQNAIGWKYGINSVVNFTIT